METFVWCINLNLVAENFTFFMIFRLGPLDTEGGVTQTVNDLTDLTHVPGRRYTEAGAQTS